MSVATDDVIACALYGGEARLAAKAWIGLYAIVERMGDFAGVCFAMDLV